MYVLDRLRINQNYRAIQDRSRKRIILHNRDLRVTAANSWHQPDRMEQKLYTIRKEPNKISEGKLTEQYDDKYLQYDTEKVSIHMLNDDCLRHIFQFLSIINRVRIERVCKRWRDLSQDSWYMVKTLDIYNLTWDLRGITDMIRSHRHRALLKILLKGGKFFTRINLNYDPFYITSGSGLNTIGSLCPNLTEIDITGKIIRASDIRTFATNCKNITKFKLRPSTESNCEIELEYLFKVHQNLEYLEITKSNISGKCLLCLPEQTVHTIILDYCHHLQDNLLSMALKKLENLKHLALKNSFGITRTYKRTLELVGLHNKNLKTLELVCLPFPMGMLDNLIHLVNLQVLKITGSYAVSDDFFIDLVQHCQQLSDIDISGCFKVRDAGLSAIATLVRLEKLTVNDMKQFTDDGLKNICGLKEFKCRGCLFRDRGIIRFIKSSPQLRLLDLTLCVQIGEATLDVAKDVCSSRTNNVMLKMIVSGTRIPKRKIDQENIPPLLHIINY